MNIIFLSFLVKEAMGEYNRVQLPVYALGSPAVHFRQHEVADEIRGVESTERANSANAFDKNSMIRVKELRADKNSGVVKTTQLLVTNANFNAGIGQPDAWGVDIRTLDFDGERAAAVVRSGGAVIGGGCRVSGMLASSVAVTDIPDTLPEHAENPQRIRMYTPCGDYPYVFGMVRVGVDNVNATQPDGIMGNWLLPNIAIPKSIESICRSQNGIIGPAYTFFVQGIGRGRGWVEFDNQNPATFNVWTTEVGGYDILIFGMRTDPAAVAATRGLNPDNNLNNFYDDPFPGDPTP